MTGTATILAGEGAGRRTRDFRRQTVIVVGAMLGNMVCANTVLVATMGVFISTLGHEYGWTRASTSLSWTAFSVVAFLGTALIGRAADRFDPGHLAAGSMLAFGVALLLVPYAVHSVTTLWIAYVVLALVGLGTSPVVLSKPVAAAFTRKRGLAIGLALAGVGVGNFIFPRVATALVAQGSWKLGYAGLGACAIAVAPLLWLTLGRRGATMPSLSSSPGSDYPGLTFREAFQSRTFWLLSAVALFGGLGMAGPAAHLIPVLCDQAMSPAAAAALASLIGLATIAGRMLTGLTLDLIDRSLPGALFLAIGALGVLLLAQFGIRFAAVSVLLIGFVIGAEVDLLGYFASRYFGLRAHATIFGWNYGMVALGSSIAPVIVGALRDRQGNYLLGLTLSSAALAIAALLCAVLGRYRYAARLQENPVA